MDNFKTYIIFGLVIVSLLLWDAWQNDYVRPLAAQQQAAAATAPPTADSALPSMPSAVPQQELADLPSVTIDGSLPEINQTVAINNANKIHIKTDVLDVYIDTQGADIRNLALLKYPVESSAPDVPVQFLDDSASRFFVTQSGLLHVNNKGPLHNSQYTAERSSYELSEGQDTLSVPFHWQSEDGISVTKTYHFHRDSYLIDVNYQITNNSSEHYSVHPYAQFNRTRPQEGSGFIYTYTGAVFSSEENNYEKIDFDDLDDADFAQAASVGWAAMIQHYFVAALIPTPQEREKSLYGRSIKERNYTAGAKMPTISIEVGNTAKVTYQMYIGPKQHQRLEAAAEHLNLTVDFGILTIISQPLFWLLEQFHKITNNWGWSIVLLTILIKLVFFQLSAKSYRSMAGMRKLTPKLATLKERFGDDKQKFNAAMMDLYRTEKINPLGGCLPILVQMPVFLAFYWVLVEAIELRQAPFIWWLQDLTAIDPYFILPLLFGLSMFFQQKLNPAPQDPAQAMVMKAFPIVFTVFFAFFPSGLVLYWVVNNILSIAQQWYITKKLGAL
ncbi:MAG: membrane protein insertase YidC [Methylophaga sp.]|nr:MAG: membrane protein insertase YidC [Methylophaga sp.]